MRVGAGSLGGATTGRGGAASAGSLTGALTTVATGVWLALLDAMESPEELVALIVTE